MASIRYRPTSTGGERWQVVWRDASRKQRSLTFDDETLAGLVRDELNRDPAAEDRILASVLDWARDREAETIGFRQGIPKRSRTKLQHRLSGPSLPPGLARPEKSRSALPERPPSSGGGVDRLHDTPRERKLQ